MNDTVPVVSPAVALTSVGGPGGTVAAIGVNEFDAAEATLDPARFTARTVQEYTVPFVSPVTLRGLALPFPDPFGKQVAV